MFENENVAQKKGSSLEEEKERRLCDWRVIDVNSQFRHVSVPQPMERMEEEWVSEVDEMNTIVFRVSVPDDVIVHIGDVSDKVSLIVKERRENG